MYHSSSSVFHDQQAPSGAKKHHKIMEPKSWNSQNSTPSRAQPHHFFTLSTSKSHKILESTHSRTMASITMALLQLYACTKHLTQQQT